MKPKATVIFDRSAFHGERFETLARSPLLELTRTGKLLVHHTPAFIEETISLYEKEKNRDVFRAQVPFILDICNGKWFLQPEEIWRLELVHKESRGSVFLTDDYQRSLEQRMWMATRKDKVWVELLEAIPFKDEERAKHKRYRDVHVDSRNEVAKVFRKGDILGEPPTAKAVIAQEAGHLAQRLIETQIKFKSPGKLLERWVRDKNRYPFFTSFVEGLVYHVWYAMTQHNKKIDPHAQEDIQLLCCLNRSDIVVSNDAGFFRDAFQELWQPKGKTMYSTGEFVSYLHMLDGQVKPLS